MRSLLTDAALDELCEVAAAAVPGCFVEVGVYQGGSAVRLADVARQQSRPFYGYDTFCGMPWANPEDGDGHPVGDFADTRYEEVCKLIPDAILVRGIFPDSLVSMPPIAFAHIDCDQYRSVLACCQYLPPLMAHCGIMVFDDYDCLDGATKAVKEAFGLGLLGSDHLTLTKRGKTMAVINVAY